MSQDHEENHGEWRHGLQGVWLWAASEDSEEDSETETDDDEAGERCSGLRQRHPRLYEWLIARVGTPGEFLFLLVFVLLSASSHVLEDSVWDSKVNVLCMNVMTSLLMLVVSLSTTFALEGSWALPRVLNWHILWRFTVVAALFQIARRLHFEAYKVGELPIVVKTLGYLYLPVSAVSSFFIFRRNYGRLEWLSLLIIVLAIATSIFLRERCRAGQCEGTGFQRLPTLWGSFLVLASVFLSCLASIVAERIYKDKSFGLRRYEEGTGHNHYYIHRVHLDFCSLVLTATAWASPVKLSAMSHADSWFGTWTSNTYWYVPAMAAYWWMAGLVAKRYSTVTKALIQTFGTASLICLEDPLFHAAQFSEVMVPSAGMLVIIALSALIFQTGRINIAHTQALRSLDAGTGLVSGVKQRLVKLMPTVSVRGGAAEGCWHSVTKYIVLVLYVVADATRTILNTQVVGQSMITPQSVAVAQTAAMLCLSHVLLYRQPPEGSSGGEALEEAWTCGEMVKFLPCGLLFACTSALTSMAFGLGISGTLNVVLGKIYLPVCALISRFLLGKHYIWLEWFAILILTVDSMAFGLLKNMGAGGRPASRLAIICCLLSASSSAMSSVYMEKLMKSEVGKPFMMQKLRVDFACFLWSVAFLPVMGLVADPEHFAKGAFWRYRPTTQACDQAGACGSWTSGSFHAWDGGGSFAYKGADGGFMPNSTLPHDALMPVECACAKGIFTCWNNALLYVALTVGIVYGFITGLVVTRFGGVIRAIADNFSLLLLYTVGDPLFNGTTLSDMSLNFTALILPLSSQTFSQAVAELQKGRDKDDTEESEEADSDDAGTDSRGSDSPR